MVVDGSLERFVAGPPSPESTPCPFTPCPCQRAEAQPGNQAGRPQTRLEMAHGIDTRRLRLDDVLDGLSLGREMPLSRRAGLVISRHPDNVSAVALHTLAQRVPGNASAVR